MNNEIINHHQEEITTQVEQLNSTTIQISDIGREIGVESDAQGRQFWKGIHLPQAIELIKRASQYKSEIIIDGGAPGFLVSALAVASQSEKTCLADPKRPNEGNKVQIIPMSIDELENGVGLENFKWKTSQKHGLTEVEFSIKGEITPADLETIKLPNIPDQSILLISGRGPNWLYASVTRGYAERAAAIACYQPGIQALQKPGVITFVHSDSEQIALGATIYEVQDFTEAIKLQQKLVPGEMVVIK